MGAWCSQNDNVKKECEEALLERDNIITTLRNEMKNQREEVNKLRVIVSNVKNVIGDRSRDDTATEIMGTDLHLHYMDNAVEHKYICDPLEYVNKKIQDE